MRLLASLHVAVGFLALPAVALGQSWNAAVDLRTNELSATETQNPNGAVPEWSYGYRPAPIALSTTLFAGAEHTNNALGNTNFQGWITPAGSNTTPLIYVDVSQAVPAALAMHPEIPGQARDSLVVRFTAPQAGTYVVNAFWLDADPRPGNPSFDGAETFVARNGVVQSGFLDINPTGGAFAEGAGSTYQNSFSLVAGDQLDFILRAGGNDLADSTSFNAIIVPEPASAAVLSVLLLGCRRRQP